MLGIFVQSDANISSNSSITRLQHRYPGSRHWLGTQHECHSRSPLYYCSFSSPSPYNITRHGPPHKFCFLVSKLSIARAALGNLVALVSAVLIGDLEVFLIRFEIIINLASTLIKSHFKLISKISERGSILSS